MGTQALGERFKNRGLRTLMSMLIMTGAFGCATQPKNKPTLVGLVPTRTARLMPGDQMEIKFYYNPELNEDVTIRPDGKVALQLIPEFTVEGLSPDELRQLLIRSYTGILDKPEVCIVVRSMKSRAVFIDGEVRSPGRLSMPGDMTILEALAESGGLKRESASPENVVVIRRGDEKTEVYSVNVAALLNGKARNAPYLFPGDLVYVPSSRIADMNLWVRQHIAEMVPQVGFTIFHDVSDNTRIGIDTSR